jgi:hypothetical protein
MTTPIFRVAFLVSQAGAAAYMAPLWHRWAGERWHSHIWLTPAAERHLWRMGFAAPASARLSELSEGTAASEIVAERPRLVVASATGSKLEADLVGLARPAGIPSVQVIDTWTNYAGRFAVACEWPDRIAVIDRRAAAEAVAEGLPGCRVVAVGQPAWEQAPSLPPAPLERAIFVGQPLRKIFADRLGYDERTAWGLCRAVAAERPDLIRHLLYLPHPEEDILHPELVPPALLAADPQAGLASCGTVLSIFSSLMVNALLGGRRVISVQPTRRGPDPCSLHRHGLVGCARSRLELEAMLTLPGRIQGAALRQDLAGSLDRFETLLLALLPAAEHEWPN